MPDAVLLSIAISLGQTEDEEDMNENSNQPLTQAFHGRRMEDAFQITLLTISPEHNDFVWFLADHIQLLKM